MQDNLTPFTFKDSGVTVQIRKVTILLWAQLREAYVRQHPLPQPPGQDVDYGDGRGVQKEENRADPAYLAALAAHEKAAREWTEQQATRLYIRRGVVCEVDPDAVAALRADMAASGVELDPDDHFVYVRYLCCATPEDYQDLVTAITQRSRPVEEAVQAAQDTFRREVPRA